jgi:hypothetical protein
MKNQIALEPLAASAAVTPVYVRMPKPGGRCPYTGLSRSTLCELTVPNKANGFQPPVPSHVVRGVAATRGIRLIPLNALLEYLGTLAA